VTSVYCHPIISLFPHYILQTALGIALISLVVAVMIMVINNTGDITTSFWDTVILTRNVNGDISSGVKLRLRAVEDGKLGYILV